MMNENDEIKDFDLSESELSEIKTAVILSERGRLREKMNTLDITEIQKIQKLKRLKSIYIGCVLFCFLIVIVLLFYRNHKQPQNNILEKKIPVDTSENLPKMDMARKVELKFKPLVSSRYSLQVQKEESLGLATKKDKMIANIYKIGDRLKDSIVIAKQVYSINQLNYTYRLSNNILSIYLVDLAEPELYKIDNQYYLKIMNSFYSIQVTAKPLFLNKLDDKDLLNRLNKIDYLQDN